MLNEILSSILSQSDSHKNPLMRKMRLKNLDNLSNFCFIDQKTYLLQSPFFPKKNWNWNWNHKIQNCGENFVWSFALTPQMNGAHPLYGTGLVKLMCFAHEKANQWNKIKHHITLIMQSHNEHEQHLIKIYNQSQARLKLFCCLCSHLHTYMLLYNVCIQLS